MPSGVALLPLRLFLGATFVYAGMQKLSDPGYLTPGASTYIGTQLRQFANGTPAGFVLRALAIPHPGLAGVLAALIELVVGVLVLAGWVTRLAALGGLAMNLLLFLSNSWNTYPYFLGSDIVFVFAWLPLVLAGAAGQPSVDTWLARSRRGGARTSAPAARQTSGSPGLAAGALGGAAGAPGLTRRAALGAGLVAAATAVLAGASLVIRSSRSPAAVSRLAQLRGSGTAGRTRRARTVAGTATSSASSAASASSSSAAGLPSGAVRLGPLTRLPRGQAAVYRDPRDGAADLAIRGADGSVTALSAICTHAGCQVSYQGGATGGQLVCPCHGSVFDAKTGAVIQGPAVTPLPKRQVVIHDGILYAVPGAA